MFGWGSARKEPAAEAGISQEDANQLFARLASGKTACAPGDSVRPSNMMPDPNQERAAQQGCAREHLFPPPFVVYCHDCPGGHHSLFTSPGGLGSPWRFESIKKAVRAAPRTSLVSGGVRAARCGVHARPSHIHPHRAPANLVYLSPLSLALPCSTKLSKERVSSTIPISERNKELPPHQRDAGTTWQYPSEQMFYNAILRKGWTVSPTSM